MEPWQWLVGASEFVFFWWVTGWLIRPPLLRSPRLAKPEPPRRDRAAIGRRSTRADNIAAIASASLTAYVTWNRIKNR